MSDIKIVVGADVAQATSGLRAVQGELGKTATVSKAATASFNSVGSSISSLSSSLISGGILTGIALVGAGLISLAKSAFEMSKEQQRLTDILSEAKGAYVKATLEVEKLDVAFKQARQGVITKEEALKLYNSTIGKTIGQTNDLDQAEKNFIANADNYIKFTLLKAAANIALGKAAEAAFKAAQEELVGPRKQTLVESFLTQGRVSNKQAQQNRINKALKEENDFKAIANSLQQQAIALGFDYNAITEKTVKIKKESVKATKEELINTDHFTKFLGELNNKLKAERATPVRPQVLVQPDFKFLPQDQEKFFAQLKAFFAAEKLKEFQDDVTSVVNQTLVNIGTDIASAATDAIGAALAGDKNALPDLFGNIIKGIGSQIKELGKYLVKAGVEMLTAKKAIEALGITPQAAIVAGIGLQILGALLTSAATNKFNTAKFASGVRDFSGGFATVGERGAERVFLPRGSSVQPNNEVNAYGGGQMVFIPDIRLHGSDLVIAFNRASQQMSRNN